MPKFVFFDENVHLRIFFENNYSHSNNSIIHSDLSLAEN